MATKRDIFAVLLLLAGTSASMAQAQELRTFAGVEAGLGTFSFEEKLDKEVVYPVASLTGGIAYGRLNAALTLSGSFVDADVSEEDYTGDASRQDFDITVGYQVLDNISLFAGYKDGETELDVVGREDEDPIRGNESYQQSGPFAGVNLGWPIKDVGKLDFSVAYAYLDADNDFIADPEDNEPGEEPEFDDIEGSNSGDSSGYSVSLGWTMPLTGSLVFRARYRYNAYEQDIDFEGVTFRDIREESSSLLLGVVGVF